MPIDSKKFKQKITEHFHNLTEEEFLENLKKSSPHFSEENSEEKERDRNFDLTPNNPEDNRTKDKELNIQE